MDKLLTTKEVADILGVHHKTVNKWLREGKLKGKKLGRVWRVRQEDLNSFIEEGNEV